MRRAQRLRLWVRVAGFFLPWAGRLEALGSTSSRVGADAEAVQLEPYAMKLHLVHDAGTHATQVHRHDHEAGR